MIKGIVFFEEYFEFMDDMTPEQYYEFMGLIRNLRFNGIDTKPEEVTDKVVRLAWRSVRPSIKKSKRNADDHNKKKQREQQEEPQVSTFTEPVATNPVDAFDPTYDDCLETLKQIMDDEGDYKMEAQANRYSKLYGYSVKEMCTTVRGH